MRYDVPHDRAALEYQYLGVCFMRRWLDRELHVYFNEVGVHVFCWEVGVFNRSSFQSVSYNKLKVFSACTYTFVGCFCFVVFFLLQLVKSSTCICMTGNMKILLLTSCRGKYNCKFWSLCTIMDITNSEV